jgi:hypothetical protein
MAGSRVAGLAPTSSTIVTCRPSEIPCRLKGRCDRTDGENAAVPATSLESGVAVTKQGPERLR